MRKFYWRWLKTAFTHALGAIDLWTGVTAAILGVADRYLPAAQLMTVYGWQIPIWALAAVMLLRLVLAPYWMWKEDEKKAARTGSSRRLVDDAHASAIREQLAESARDRREHERAVEAKRSIRNKLAEFIERADPILTELRNVEERPPTYAIGEWNTCVEEFLVKELDASYVPLFRDGAGVVLDESKRIAMPPHRNYETGMLTRLARLREFIRELR